MRSLYRRRFLVISRGIGQIEDTYLLSQHARDYTRSHLLPESPRRLPIEALTPTGQTALKVREVAPAFAGDSVGARGIRVGDAGWILAFARMTEGLRARGQR